MRSVALLGTGLIGGSIGLGLKRAAPGTRVVGFDPDAATSAVALERSAIDAAARSTEAAVDGADTVVLALPVDQIPNVCRNLAGAVAAGALVTDVGSAKQEVVRHGTDAFGDRFVGGHPMAGSERHGIEAADARLFEDVSWILTPTDRTSSDAYSRATDLVAALGAKPVALAPDAHDALVARLSHVPQLTASALVEVAAAAGDERALLGLAGAGFRDVTRIAASNPDLWVAIVRSNTRSVLEGLAALESTLHDVADMVARERWYDLRAYLDRARAARLHIFAKPDYGGEPVGLSTVIPDRPGVLAEVTTAAGNLGINIEDLRIVHSTEGGRGRLEIIVAGPEAADVLAKGLSGLGYRVERIGVDT